MAMDAKKNPIFDGSETFDQFDIELHLLNKNMWYKVVKEI
jgi:hypothetical protein